MCIWSVLFKTTKSRSRRRPFESANTHLTWNESNDCLSFHCPTFGSKLGLGIWNPRSSLPPLERFIPPPTHPEKRTPHNLTPMYSPNYRLTMVCIILEGYTFTYLPLLTLTPEPSIDKIKPNPLQPLRPPPVFKYFVSITK